MSRRSSRKHKIKDLEGTDTLKMVLKLSAQEHNAKNQSPSSSESEISENSDSEIVNNVGAKRNKRMPGSSSTIKKSRLMDDDDRKSYTPSGPSHTERGLRDRFKPPSPKSHTNALTDTLVYLQKLMERKDNQHFFAFPINDIIAPGYSKVVKHPMDLSTTKSKIEQKVYRNLMEYKSDIKLICVNAMNYNHPDTIFYKAAQKLLEYAMKAMSKDKLLNMRKNQPFMSGLLDSEMALHLDVDASEYIAPTRVQKKQKDSNAYLTFEPIPDHLPVKDIISIAKERAAEAAEHLSKNQPNAKMGFLRMAEDGTTTLNILNPDNSGIISQKERVITLGDKLGRLKSGRSYLESINVDNDYTEVKGVRYLDYGPFSSSAPTYDSSFANLTKQETDLLLSYYGSQNSIDYIQSLRTFVADCSESMIEMIENLIDSKTGGKHSQGLKALKEIRSKGMDAEDPGMDGTPNESGNVNDESQTLSRLDVDYESLKSLTGLGIDMSFLDYFKSKTVDDAALEKTAEQVAALQQMQNERLAQHPALDKSKNITEAEEATAASLAANLASLAKQTKPGNLYDEVSLHSVIGIGMVSGPAKSDADKVDDTIKACDELDSNPPTETLDHHILIGKSP